MSQKCQIDSVLALTPPDLIARIAALVPPPRTYRHRYFGVLPQTICAERLLEDFGAVFRRGCSIVRY
jgi:Putative transposase